MYSYLLYSGLKLYAIVALKLAGSYSDKLASLLIELASVSWLLRLFNGWVAPKSRSDLVRVYSLHHKNTYIVLPWLAVVSLLAGIITTPRSTNLPIDHNICGRFNASIYAGVKTTT